METLTLQQLTEQRIPFAINTDLHYLASNMFRDFCTVKGMPFKESIPGRTTYEIIRDNIIGVCIYSKESFLFSTQIELQQSDIIPLRMEDRSVA